MPTERSVAITGMGVVTPAGCTLDDLWDVLRAGRSVAATVTDPAFKDLSVAFACRVRGFEACDVVTGKAARRMDPFARYGVTAAVTAYQDAGAPTVDTSRAAVVVGNGVGGAFTSETQGRNYLELGPSKVNPLTVPMTMPNAACALITMRLGWRGPSLSIATACASGGHAIGEGLEMLRSGRADLVLAGGTEATITPASLNSFTNLQALSTRIDDPERASRPFDVDRDGFVMGEGAAFMVLERLADARARGASPYAVLQGYGSNTDAYHLVMPARDGVGAAECMAAALADAGMEAGDVGHINAHGTSTPLNDRAEARAIRKVFGPDAPPVTSVKGAIGHLVGAAGAVELVASVLAIRHGEVPPTANYERSDPDMDIDVVHGAPRLLPEGAVVSNSFGFGGHNVSLVVSAA